MFIDIYPLNSEVFTFENHELRDSSVSTPPGLLTDRVRMMSVPNSRLLFTIIFFNPCLF